jgi:hypothetical protein
MHEYHCRRDYEFFSAEIPWIKSITNKLGFPVVPKFVDDANQYLEDCGDLQRDAGSTWCWS